MPVFFLCSSQGNIVPDSGVALNKSNLSLFQSSQIQAGQSTPPFTLGSVFLAFFWPTCRFYLVSSTINFELVLINSRKIHTLVFIMLSHSLPTRRHARIFMRFLNKNLPIFCHLQRWSVSTFFELQCLYVLIPLPGPEVGEEPGGDHTKAHRVGKTLTQLGTIQFSAKIDQTLPYTMSSQPLHFITVLG